MDRYTWSADPEERLAALRAWEAHWRALLNPALVAIATLRAMGSLEAPGERELREPLWRCSVRLYLGEDHERPLASGHTYDLHVYWWSWMELVGSLRPDEVARALDTEPTWRVACAAFDRLTGWCVEQAAELVTS